MFMMNLDVKVEKFTKRNGRFCFTRYEYDGADNIISVKKGAWQTEKRPYLSKQVLHTI